MIVLLLPQLPVLLTLVSSEILNLYKLHFKKKITGETFSDYPANFMSLGTTENKAIELNAESLLFTDRKVSSFWGPNEKCEVEYSAGALETTFKREDASDVKDDVMIMEQVAAQINEEQFSQHKTAEEALEPENMLVTVHGTSGNKTIKNESSMFEHGNSASDRINALHLMKIQ